MSEQENNEQIAKERRAQRLREMQKRKKQQEMFRRYLKLAVPAAAGILLLAVALFAGGKILHKEEKAAETEIQAETDQAEALNGEEVPESIKEDVTAISHQIIDSQIKEAEDGKGEIAQAEIPKTQEDQMQVTNKVYKANVTQNTKQVSDEVVSKHALLIDLENDTILAQRSATAIIDPASMTKIMTVLVAAEQIEKAQLEDTFTITLDITDYGYVNDCSSAGFLEDETVTVRDLFYGTILPSGADAALGLATYVAGDHEAFVELMNQKLEELGLSDTAHFTNCVGLYDEEHYCTIYDMAMILEAALDNELCREVLSAHTYTTSPTEQHPEGIILSNWFLRRIEDKDTGGEVLCAKTGYVMQSGNCAASYGVSEDGRKMLCVTADSTSAWRCIYDHVALYKEFSTETWEMADSGN